MLRIKTFAAPAYLLFQTKKTAVHFQLQYFDWWQSTPHKAAPVSKTIKRRLQKIDNVATWLINKNVEKIKEIPHALRYAG
jgi:hypothetical protein